MAKSTDRDWETLGRSEPYWSVISDPAYRRANLTEDARQRFFATGETYVQRLWEVCRKIDERFAPRRVLDFGCGVGRVALPLARRCDEVVGADVSDAMISEASQNRDRAGQKNLRLIRCDGRIDDALGDFDFVHSLLTFQHIPAKRGVELVRNLVGRARLGSFVAVHVLFDHPELRGNGARTIVWLNRWLRRLFTPMPPMEMHPYPLAHVLVIAQDAGAWQVHVELTNHDGRRGALLVFKTGGSASPIA